ELRPLSASAFSASTSPSLLAEHVILHLWVGTRTLPARSSFTVGAAGPIFQCPLDRVFRLVPLLGNFFISLPNKMHCFGNGRHLFKTEENSTIFPRIHDEG